MSLSLSKTCFLLFIIIERNNYPSQAHILNHSFTQNTLSFFGMPSNTKWELVSVRFLTKFEHPVRSDFHIILINGLSSNLNSSMEFHLMKKKLKNTDFTIIVRNGDVEAERIRSELSDCLYSATSALDSGLKAFFSTCGHGSGFSGVIMNSEGHWRIEPHPDKASMSQNKSIVMHVMFSISNNERLPNVIADGNSFPEAVHREAALQQVVYEANANIMTTTHGIDNDSDPESNEETDAKFELLGSKSGKGKKNPQTNKATASGRRVVEIAVFVDPPLFAKLQALFPSDTVTKAKEYILTLINTMDLLYKQPSLGIPLSFRLVHLEIQKSWPSNLNHYNGAVDKYLDAFCDYAGGLNSNNQQWDHGLMLTGFDLHQSRDKSVAGVAYAETMCNRYYSCSLSEGYDFGGAYVITHEIGHSLGMEHDGEGVSRKCHRAKFIMAAFTGAGQVTWSTCSRKNFQDFLKYGTAGAKKKQQLKPSCLTKSGKEKSAITFSNGAKLPGEKYNAAKQCSIYMGKDSVPYLTSKAPTNNICRMLYCTDKKKVYESHPALEGTLCSTNTVKHCRRGRCVPKT